MIVKIDFLQKRVSRCRHTTRIYRRTDRRVDALEKRLEENLQGVKGPKRRLGLEADYFLYQKEPW